MLRGRERLMAYIENDPLHLADVICVLEGDGLHRMAYGADLYNSKLAPEIFITGGRIDEKAGCIPANRLKKIMWLKHGVPEDVIATDLTSMNTHEQAIALCRRASDECWNRVLLVASHYHQYRAYLTCLKAMQDHGREFWIINAPARDLPWFEDEGWDSRSNLLINELDKIDEYSKLGHIADLGFAIEYQYRKEQALR